MSKQVLDVVRNSIPKLARLGEVRLGEMKHEESSHKAEWKKNWNIMKVLNRQVETKYYRVFIQMMHWIYNNVPKLANWLGELFKLLKV